MEMTIYALMLWIICGVIGYLYIHLQVFAFHVADISDQKVHVTLLKSVMLGFLIVFEIRRLFRISLGTEHNVKGRP